MSMIYSDSHIHMVLDGKDFKQSMLKHKDKPDDKTIRSILSLYKEKGYTFLRDGGDKYKAGLYAKSISEEYGITYLSPSFPISKAGYYGSFIGKTFEYEKEYRRLIEEAKSDGADFIKLMLSGILDFDEYGKMLYDPLPDKDIKEMVKIAKGEGFAVMAHCSGQKSIMAALEAGVDSIEHGYYIEDEGLWALSELPCAWVPTISTTGNLLGVSRYNQKEVKKIFDSHARNIEIAARRAVVIASGSDAGAFNVLHAKGGLDEYTWLSKYIDNVDEVLLKGEDFIRNTFTKH